MSVIAGWSPDYYMEYSSGTTPTSLVRFTTGGTSGLNYVNYCFGGYGRNKPEVYLTNTPTFGPGREVNTNDKVTGYPFPLKGGNTTIERDLGDQLVETSYEMQFEPASALIPFVTLLQDTTWENTATASTKAIKLTAYSSGATVSCSRYANLLRKIENGGHQLITGAVAKSITVAGSEGEPITISVDWIGASYDGAYTESADFPIWTTSHCFKGSMFSDVTVEIDGNSDVQISGFELTVNNNLVPKRYNNEEVQAFVLGSLEVTGSLTFPWGESNIGDVSALDWFTGLSGVTLDIYKDTNYYVTDSTGTTSTDNIDFSFSSLIQLDDLKVNAEDEVENEINFTGVYAGDRPVFFAAFYDNLSRGWTETTG